MNIFKIIIILPITISVFLLAHHAIVKFSNHIDSCLDSGWCQKGTTVNINNTQIIVNENSCINNNGKWIEHKQICHFKHQFSN